MLPPPPCPLPRRLVDNKQTKQPNSLTSLTDKIRAGLTSYLPSAVGAIGWEQLHILYMYNTDIFILLLSTNEKDFVLELSYESANIKIHNSQIQSTYSYE